MESFCTDLSEEGRLQDYFKVYSRCRAILQADLSGGEVVRFWITKKRADQNPGTSYDSVQFCPVGIYMIMKVKAGQVSKAGWGRPKSRIG